MFKKFLCVLCTLVILIPIAVLSASADDTVLDITTTNDVNLWTASSWSDYISTDYAKTLTIDNLQDYADSNLNCAFRFDKKYTSNGSFLSNSFFCLVESEVSFEDNSSSEYSALLTFSGDEYVYNPVADTFRHYEYSVKSILFSILYSGSYADNYCYIVEDIDVYKSLIAKFPDFKNQIYYCADIVQSYIDYILSVEYDDMFYDVYPLQDGHQNIIRFYDCFDSYYGKYHYDFYKDNMLNYLNSSFSINSPIYYQAKNIDTGHQLDDADLQHNEMYYIYIPVDDDFTVDKTNEYLTSIGTAIHYEKGPIDFGTWYNDYIKPWLSKFSANSDYKLITLKDVEPSTSDNPTVNTTDTKQDVKLLRLTFPSAYTFLESSEDDGGFIMSGCRTMSTAQKVDISNGSIDNTAKDGIGSDIDGGDYSDDKDADELLADGWKNGYPNKASYPYKITVNKNGYVLYEIYFDKKPTIEANFYSHSQIAYDIDFDLTCGYFYAAQQNCYIDFDFRNNYEDDYVFSDGTLVDDVTDVAKKAMAKEFVKIVNCFINGVGYASQGSDYEAANYEKYLTQKIMRVWTNYTGQLTGTYRGYYVQFNWDLEQDDDFVKNNSDDNHNYSDDFLDDGDGFVDNNGNVHGGAVEPATNSPNYNGFNNDDFSFDETNLWDYANSFLKFSAKAFSVLPSFVWYLIASSIVIIIILRILGR